MTINIKVRTIAKRQNNVLKHFLVPPTTSNSLIMLALKIINIQNAHSFDKKNKIGNLVNKKNTILGD